MQTRIDFIGKDWVVYTTAIAGNAFQSLHKRTGMTTDQARKAFHREHKSEVFILLNQKKQNENKSIAVN